MVTPQQQRFFNTRLPFSTVAYKKGFVTGHEENDIDFLFTGNINPRLNLGVEWAMHFSTSDKLDGVVDPYGIKSTGLFKNRDCFSALQLTLTYSFMAKCKTCNNDKDD